jgi:hypothetical protein
MSRNSRLIYGLDAPPAEPVLLRAGPLTMQFDNGDLRYIKHGDTEIVRRIYAAARDRDWGTAPNVLSGVAMDIRDDAFDITYTCVNRHADIHFVWTGALSGRRDGRLVFSFDGVARKSFLRARLGLCVLHPASASGDVARVEQVDGSAHITRFPRRIAPQMIVDGVIKPVAPFESLRAIEHRYAAESSVRIAFAGEVFEMEDQRNWTDGSFKTYCTPLSLPVPVQVAKGARVIQRVTVSLAPARRAGASKPVTRRAYDDAVAVSVLSGTQPLPAIGLGAGLSLRAMTDAEHEHLTRLPIAHLRAELPLYARDWRETLARAARHAASLSARLELAAFVDAKPEAELGAFASALAALPRAAIARILIFERAAFATSAPLIALARKQLGAHAPLFAGTNKFFTQLNCNRPGRQSLAMLDGLCYGFNPQVHAFDNQSIAEAPEAQAETVRTAHAFARGLPIAITPITLKPRFSLGDNGPEPRARRFEFDPREQSLFGAAWTAASLKHIASAGGVASTTWYDAIDNRGLVKGDIVFPGYHVFASLGEMGGVVVMTRSSDPLRVEALALRSRDGKRTRVVLVNLSARAQTVRLKGVHGVAAIRRLDASTLREAMHIPDGFRAQPGAIMNDACVELAPCALAEVDVA